MCEALAPPWHEDERLAALASYRIVDTPADPAFDAVAQLAAQICRAPIALISLVEETRQWFKARIGLDADATPRDVSICGQAILQRGLFVVPDTAADPRFSANPLVAGPPHLRFYAGALLETREGLPLGTVCVLDHRPRPEGLSEDQAFSLQALARQVMAQLELRKALAAKADSERQLSLAVDATGLGLWTLDPAAGTLEVTEQCRRLLGLPEAGPIRYADWLALIHPEDGARHAALAERAFAPDGDGRFEDEFRLLPSVRGRVWIAATGKVDREATATAPRGRLVGTLRDVTQRRRQIEALAEGERRFRAMADSLPQMVWSTQPDGFHDYYNRRWYEFTGVPEGSTDGAGWNGMFHPEDQEGAWARWRRSLATGEPYEIEYRLRRHDGTYRWVLGRALPIRDESGAIDRWFGTCTDIHERKEAEEAHTLISRELSHRIKNIFTVIGSLITLSARGDRQARPFAEGLRHRLLALAQAHEYVRPHSPFSRGPAETTVHGLTAELLSPYQEAGSPRIRIEGDDAAIGPHAATALALVLHEQATNAVKYGALSAPGGRVTIRGTREGETFRVQWIERGGPPIAGPPEHRGFGTVMAGLGVSAQLGGTLTQDWAADGLTVTLTIPAERLGR